MSEPPTNFNLHLRCLVKDGNIDLKKGKIYKGRLCESPRDHFLYAVVDESGEDYLYPKKWFEKILDSFADLEYTESIE